MRSEHHQKMMEMHKQQMEAMKADVELITREVPSQRIIEIVLTAPDAGADQKRFPLNLGLVLDRSGSMADANKLTYARQAVLGLLSRLSEADRFALVSYRDRGDDYVTRVNDFTTDVAAFHRCLRVWIWPAWYTSCSTIPLISVAAEFCDDSIQVRSPS